MLYSKSWLYSSVYLLNLILLIYPFSPSPFGNFFMSISLFCKQIPIYYFLDSTYKWYHIFVFLWFISLSMIISRSTLQQVAIFHSFLWLSTIVFNYNALYMHYTYYIFFIHSSVDGHSGCFHVLATVVLFLIFWLSHTTCGPLVPQSDTEPTPTTWEAERLNHWPAKKVPVNSFLHL